MPLVQNLLLYGKNDDVTSKWDEMQKDLRYSVYATRSAIGNSNLQDRKSLVAAISLDFIYNPKYKLSITLQHIS